VRRVLPSALMVVAAAVAGCGGGSSTTSDIPSENTAPAQGGAAPDASFQHVHGLGINPKDGTLMIATHTGLFRAGKNQQTATRVGDSEQDVMGFTVVGPDRFLGSGHPDPRQTDQPPNLGLIRSTSAGQDWSPVSLTGQADFHVLRSLGARVFGFNGLTGKLMVSGDGGRTWQARTPPGPLLDLAIHPTDPRHLVASTDNDLIESADDGRSWRPLRRQAVGLLAWPSPKQLVWIDGSGDVHSSENGGRTWRDGVGSIGAQPAAFAAHGSDLYAARVDGNVVRSSDGGATWALRARP
jgi:photosystem II stability/assembly factor-like uncharacterized protein